MTTTQAVRPKSITPVPSDRLSLISAIIETAIRSGSLSEATAALKMAYREIQTWRGK